MILVQNLHLRRYHIYSNNCTIIRYNNILTCGNPATCFGQFQGGIQQKYTMASYVIGVQLAGNDINVFVVVMEMQQLVPFALLLRYKIFCHAVYKKRKCLILRVYVCILVLINQPANCMCYVP